MGDERQQVEKQPHGYYLKRLMMPSQQEAGTSSYIATMNNDSNGLVTIDKIWQLEESIMPVSSKDLCLSFALFKLLRCRFAGYTAAETGSARAHNFIWQLLLTNNDRPLGVITNELSFLHDFYYSSAPIYYSKRCLPILSFLISLFTICYCLLAGILVTAYQLAYRDFEKSRGMHGWGQIYFQLSCYNTATKLSGTTDYLPIGSLFYDVVPTFVLLGLVVLAEAREIASCICSNWAKVALICRQLNNKQLLLCPRLKKCIYAALRCRCNLVNPFDDKMRQWWSILAFHSRKGITGLVVCRLHHLLGKKKSVKVPSAVKAAIVNTLRSTTNGQLSNGVGFLRRRNLQDHGGHNNNGFLWACIDGKGTTDVMLVWHIATSILEVKLHHQPSSSSSFDNQIAATHLSRYCAYLVACCQELLPDDDKWSKSLYDAVSKDSMPVLAMASRGGADAHEQMVALLTEKSEHEVVKKGARLGKQLAQLDDKEAAWSLLAGVWLEMILYVAPSENLNAHSDTIAHGGELITVIWALLMHLGFTYIE